MGKCPDCGAWDALERYSEPTTPKSDEGRPDGLVELWAGDGPRTAPAPTPVTEIESENVSRIPTGIGELDRVLGGGLVPGSVVLLGGDPGIGKSTLLLQAAGELARTGCRTLYVSSEESAYQTRLRAERIIGSADDLAAVSELLILAGTNLQQIVEAARQVRPGVLIIDSIQMIYSQQVDASPGSVSQLRRCCTDLVYLAKASGMTIILVGHVTKDGQLAGPKLIEHLVDAVLSFEGDRHHAHRVVRGIKNRYGTTLEVGLFEMTGSGLAQIADPAGPLDPEAPPRPGSVVCPAIHGTRCLLVEIQALTATGFLGSAKRKTSGLDSSRLSIIIAVLEKHAGLRLADQDVFASAVGGLKVIEPAADLALCMAIAGAHYGRSLSPGVAVVGEVGLGGEIRPVQQMAGRAREASRLGYRTLLTANPAENITESGWEAAVVTSITEAMDLLA